MAFESQIEDVSVKFNKGAALADRTDHIFLFTNEDFIEMHLKGYKENFIVCFDSCYAKIPEENGTFQLPAILSANKVISLENFHEGFIISGTNLYLQPR